MLFFPSPFCPLLNMRPLVLVSTLLLAGNITLGYLLLTSRSDPNHHAEPTVADAELSETSPARDASATATPEEPSVETGQNRELDSLQAKNDALLNEIGDLKHELSVYNAHRQRPSAAPANQSAELPAGPLIQMLGDEATADLALEWIRADQSRRFASLIGLAELQPESKDKLLQLLTERYATRSDIGQFGADALPSDEQQGLENDYRSQLSSLVGDEMTELFLKAETKPLSFARIQEIDTQLRFDGGALTREQYLPLWNLLSSTIQVGVSVRDAASLAAVTERAIANNLSILPEAQQVLTPTQYASFEQRIHSDITQMRVREHLMQQRYLQSAQQNEATQIEPQGPAERKSVTPAP